MSDTVDLEACVLGWEPSPVAVVDAMDPARTEALGAVLDRPVLDRSLLDRPLLDRQGPGGPVLPALWHWVHFVSWPPTGALGADGHPEGGDFLPPIPDRTRMFVGARLAMPGGLRTGVPARRSSTVTSCEVKHGRSGSMLLVTVRHEISQEGEVALVEEQDLMYRSGTAARRPVAAGVTTVPTSDAPWQEVMTAGPIVLFRYSALTANSHRIHYDLPYATGVEGYPGLVVHGPLLATLLAGLAERRRPGRRMTSLQFRFLRPVISGEPVLLTGRPTDAGADLAVIAADGQESVRAAATFTT